MLVRCTGLSERCAAYDNAIPGETEQRNLRGG
jgi:hypothetical protein